jgi:hypothetical protein
VEAASGARLSFRWRVGARVRAEVSLAPTRVSDEDLRSTDTTSRDFGGRLLNWICQCHVSRRTGVYYSIHYRSAVPSKVSRELQRIHRGAKK